MTNALLLFGASRGTGFELARLARQAGSPVYAMTRSHSEDLEQLGVHQFTGDAAEASRTAEACIPFHDVEAAISTMGGGTSDGDGNIHVIDAVRAAGIRRFVLVSSLGAGESRAYASQRLLDAIGPVLEEKTRAEIHLAGSGLDFTILRPGQLLDGLPTGQAVLREDPSLHGGIPRAELAGLILQVLENPDSIGRTYTAVIPKV
jgi:uncharacterized protein YbjT (DUF2867 family)